jgi:ATP-dependent Zn protease
VRSVLEEAYDSAKAILVEQRDQLERITEELLVRETLDQAEFAGLLAVGSGADPS